MRRISRIPQRTPSSQQDCSEHLRFSEYNTNAKILNLKIASSYVRRFTQIKFIAFIAKIYGVYDEITLE